MRPILTTRPSLTAITAAREREKIWMPRRAPSDSTTIAALPVSTRLPRFFSCSAYVALAWIGKRPWVRPVSEPMRSPGRPPMIWARIRTESTYQLAWL